MKPGTIHSHERVARVAAIVRAKPMAPTRRIPPVRRWASRTPVGKPPRGRRGVRGMSPKSGDLPSRPSLEKFLLSQYGSGARSHAHTVHTYTNKIQPRAAYTLEYECTHRSNVHRPSAGRAAFSPWLSRGGMKTIGISQGAPRSPHERARPRNPQLNSSRCHAPRSPFLGSAVTFTPLRDPRLSRVPPMIVVRPACLGHSSGSSN